MADTGERSPTAASGFTAQDNLIYDGNESTYTYHLQCVTNISNYGYVCCVDGSDIPAGATINGVKLILRSSYSSTYDATKVTLMAASLDGVSGTYSSALADVNLTTTDTDHEFGGATELWGLDWSSWTDVSDLAFRWKSDQQSSSGIAISGYMEADAVVYYTEASTDVPSKVTIKGGSLTIRGGSLTIK